NGQEAGSVVELPKAATVQVRAEAQSLEPYESLELVMNGEVIQRVEPTGPQAQATLEQDVKVRGNSCLAARCSYQPMDEHSFVMPSLGSAAHTSPIYVRLQGKPLRADRKAAAILDSALEETLNWVGEHARCQTEQQRENLAAIFRDAREKLA